MVARAGSKRIATHLFSVPSTELPHIILTPSKHDTVREHAESVVRTRSYQSDVRFFF